MAKMTIFFTNGNKARFTNTDERPVKIMLEEDVRDAIPTGFPNNIPAGRVVINWANVSFIRTEPEEDNDDAE